MNDELAPSSARAARKPVGAGLRTAVFDGKCLAVLALMRLALSTIGYTAISQRLTRPAGQTGSRFWARQVGRRIERLAHFVPGASCLTQALALQFILGRAGHTSQLQIGVRQDDKGAFLAHAWVTCDGRIVLGQSGTDLTEFTRMTELG